MSTKAKPYKPQRFTNTKKNDSVGGILCNNINTNSVDYNHKEIRAKPKSLNIRDISNCAKMNKPEKYGYNMYVSQFYIHRYIEHCCDNR